jgi:hypothetical protein
VVILAEQRLFEDEQFGKCSSEVRFCSHLFVIWLKPCKAHAYAYYIHMNFVWLQIAYEFELEKNYLLGPSTNVKSLVEGVAANAASIVALEVGLASAGLIIARIVGGSSFHRRRRIPSSHARLLACALTASVVLVLNAPNFAFIRKSLHSAKDKTVLYTRASVQQYKVGNYSGFLMSETHAFVEGSGVTAIIGLMHRLYLVVPVISRAVPPAAKLIWTAHFAGHN